MRSNNSFIKKQKAEEKRKKRLAKLEKKHQKKNDTSPDSWENMIAYVDKNGNITTEPPADEPKNKNNQNSINNKH